MTDIFPPLPKENDVLAAPKPNPALGAFLAQRRSTKIAFMGGPGPDSAALSEILMVATRVPDHGKLAPWRFIILADEGRARAGEIAKKIAQTLRGHEDAQIDRFEAERFLRSPVVVAVVSSTMADNIKVPVWEQELSAGALCYNIILASDAAGFAATWLSEWVMFHPDFAAEMGLKSNERFAGFLYIGTPNAAPIERGRPDVAAITTYF